MAGQDHSESWGVPIVGFRAIDVWFSGQIYVIAYGKRIDGQREAPRSSIAFGGPFHYRDQSGVEHRLNATDPWETLVPILSVRHARVASATVDKDSQIAVVFENGASLSAGPDDRYENWEVAGPGSLNLVAMPGGGDPRISGQLGMP